MEEIESCLGKDEEIDPSARLGGVQGCAHSGV